MLRIFHYCLFIIYHWILFIYYWNKNKRLINPSTLNIAMQTNKQNKIVCQQQKSNKETKKQQVTATKLRKDFFKVFFCLFIFVILFWTSTKIDLVNFFGLLTKIGGKSYCISKKTFFGLHLKLTKKSYCISLFSNRAP